jgi:hypothetical protein
MEVSLSLDVAAGHRPAIRKSIHRLQMSLLLALIHANRIALSSADLAFAGAFLMA